MSKPIQTHYIIGIGRSGTSLLMSLLGAHPSIWPTPENYFTTFFAHKYANKTEFSAKDNQLMNRFNIAFGKLQPYIGFDFEPFSENESFKGTYFEWCCVVYQQFKHSTLEKKDISIILDKNPSNTLFTSSLKKINPDAKYILMIRDYRANILSRKESIHLRSGNAVFNAIRWNIFTKKALRFQAEHPNNVITVRYEDLISQTDLELERIFTFFGISNMLSEELREIERKSYEAYLNNPVFADNERIKKKYGDLAKPIFNTRIDKWKTNLTPTEIENTELVCGKIGQKFAYQETTQLSSIQKLIRTITFLPKQLKIRFTFLKDNVFFYLPIEMKVSRFEKYVEHIRKTKRHEMDI